MLFDASEEGPTPGLGILRGRRRAVPRRGDDGAGGARLKVPHMGWSPVDQARAASALARHPRRRAGSTSRTAIHPDPADPDVIAGTADYPAPFTCAIARANIFATQFHPEKSHRAGLQLLANFVAWDGRA